MLHIWHVDPKTKIRKYVRAVATDTEYLLWKREQPMEVKEQYLCNNVSPTGTVGHTVRPRTLPSSAAADAMAAARAKSRAKDAERRKKREADAAKAAERKAENDREMAGIRKDAEVLVEKHKRDEAADLAAGINH